MKSITEKLYNFLIPLVFTFPLFKESISSAMIIALSFNTILFYISHKTAPKIQRNLLLLTIPFGIVVLHSLLSNQLAENQIHIRHALLFLIIPLCFSLIPIRFFDAKKMRLYFSVLKNTCLIIGVIYLVSYFSNHTFQELFVVFQNVSSFRDYVYNDIEVIKIHPTYYTSFLILCCIQSFDRVLKQNKYWELLYVAFFLLISFLLLSKLNIVFLVLSIVGMQLFRSSFSTQKKIIYTFALTLCIGLLVVSTPGIKSRFTEVFTTTNKAPVGLNYDSTSVRKAIFDCSISLIKSDYLLGVGFGDLQNRLNQCYQHNYVSNFYTENQYMTHNYFFYILIGSGIFGFLFFMFYVFQIIKIAFQTRSFIFNIFLVNIFLMCLIEDFLYRHYGGLFFNVILLLFIRHHEHLKTAVAQK